MKVFSELAKDRRAWDFSVRDVVNSIGDALGSPEFSVCKSALIVPLLLLATNDLRY